MSQSDLSFLQLLLHSINDSLGMLKKIPGCFFIEHPIFWLFPGSDRFNMELLEYQAKELFQQVGIPVLPSQRINQPRDLRGLTIPYPVVLKSQVYTGQRAKAGGIRFVGNTIDAMAVAQTIFHLPIMGTYPEVLLAEAKYDADREFYLAVVLDSSSRRPVLLGSQQGGAEVESQLDQIQQVIVDRRFSPFYARRLALKMGLKGNLIQSVSAIVEKMYDLFIRQDLDLIEINPLGVSASGALMALDGKITVNDAALGRHPNLIQLVSQPSAPATPPTSLSPTGGLNLVELEGNIGILCNGAGLSMATLDLLHKAKGKPAGFVDVGMEYGQGSSFVPLQERIEQGLDCLQQIPGLRAILINIIGSFISCAQVAEVIASYLNTHSFAKPTPPIVVRLMGEQFPQAQTLLANMDIPVIESLDQAITEVITLAKATKP